jgi:tetratricopeptide (TPR) repeat protein
MMQAEVVVGMRLTARIALMILLVSFSASAQSRAASDDKRHQAALAFEEGQNAHERGDLLTAVRHYTAAIASEPSLFQPYYQRAMALMALGRASEAAKDFRKVIELNPSFPAAHRGLGRILLDEGSAEEAGGELARALELDPRLKETRIYLASALLRKGAAAEAAETLRQAIELGEADSLAFALLGVATERAGKVDESLAHFNRAIEMDSSNATAREGRARIMESRGETARAIEDYTLAYRAQPSTELAVKLAQLHTRAGQPQAAIQIYRNLVRERPEDFTLRAALIRLMAANDQAEEAFSEIERLIAGQPRNAKMLALAGDLFFEDKPEQAASFYSRAIEIDPADNDSRVRLGAALVRSQQYEAALAPLSSALDRDADNHSARASLATALFKLKQYPQAARQFIWLIEKKPQVATSYYFLAISLDRMGDCAQATRAYREFARRADAAVSKNELEETAIRLSLLDRLAREGKCKGLVKEKSK